MQNFQYIFAILCLYVTEFVESVAEIPFFTESAKKMIRNWPEDNTEFSHSEDRLHVDGRYHQLYLPSAASHQNPALIYAGGWTGHPLNLT